LRPDCQNGAGDVARHRPRRDQPLQLIDCRATRGAGLLVWPGRPGTAASSTPWPHGPRHDDDRLLDASRKATRSRAGEGASVWVPANEKSLEAGIEPWYGSCRSWMAPAPRGGLVASKKKKIINRTPRDVERAIIATGPAAAGRSKTPSPTPGPGCRRRPEAAAERWNRPPVGLAPGSARRPVLDRCSRPEGGPRRQSHVFSDSSRHNGG
jgi:hypothetical protein